jgi:hypothetical protein
VWEQEIKVLKINAVVLDFHKALFGKQSL